MTIRLQEADRARVRHHLGFMSIEPVSSIQLGFPAASQPQFLVEIAMDRLIPEVVGIVQKDLAILDGLEDLMVQSFRTDKVQQLGELKLRNSNEEPNEHDLLERKYLYWAGVLADDLGVDFNPFSRRFRAMTAGMINIPIARV